MFFFFFHSLGSHSLTFLPSFPVYCSASPLNSASSCSIHLFVCLFFTQPVGMKTRLAQNSQSSA